MLFRSSIHCCVGASGSLEYMIQVLRAALGEESGSAVLDFVAAPDFEARLAWSRSALWEAVSAHATDPR